MDPRTVQRCVVTVVLFFFPSSPFFSLSLSLFFPLMPGLKDPPLVSTTPNSIHPAAEVQHIGGYSLGLGRLMHY